MSGELALAASLASYGNRWLRSEQAVPLQWQHLSAFRHVNECRFAQTVRRLFVFRTWTEVAGSPAEWLSWLARNGVSSLELVISADLRYFLRVAAMSPEIWVPRLKRARVPNAAKPWDQWYFAGKHEAVARQPLKSVPAASAALELALESIVAFAENEGLDEWASRFGAGRAILKQRADAPIPYYPDLIATAQREAHRLAAAAVSASLFAGAGSWSDVAPELRKRADYVNVSTAARAAVLDGVAAAANAAGDP